MDIFHQLNEIEDLEMRTLLIHAVRCSLTHTLVTAQVLANTDNPQAAQAAQIHQETVAILNAITAKIIESNKKAA
jgi:hypothetical protein